jgi:hypothetical protein
MKTGRRGLILVAALIVGLASFPETLSAADSKPSEGFRTEGTLYVSVARGSGAGAQEAESAARTAALNGLYSGLGLDALFAEVFASSPPAGLSFELLSSVQEGASYKALVELKIDDESVRIVQRGPYLAAATALLDKAEGISNEAESRRAAAAESEVAAELGPALGQYGMAVDGGRSALDLLAPLSDPNVFSSKGKRTAPELKKVIASILSEAEAGIERVKKAEAALATDESTQKLSQAADETVAAADAAEAFLDSESEALDNPSACKSERLSPLRDKLGVERRSLADARESLQRARKELPSGEGLFVRDKLEFADRRLSSAEAAVDAAFKSVDREIRDPAAARAARAAALRWIFLHEPREYLSLRAYMPFALGTGEQGFVSSPFDAQAQIEGAFAFGGPSGIWLRSRANYDHTDLRPSGSGGDETALTQSFDLGFWGKGLMFAGYGWDWSRRVDGASYPKTGTVDLGFGGVYPHGRDDERFYRADWLVTLSYELPYETAESQTWQMLNGGLETQFRLGKLALFEAAVSERLDERAEDDYVALLRWRLGLGLRLPAPFALGVEYSGCILWPLLADGNLGEAEKASDSSDEGAFRFYLQYSL